MPSLIEQMQAAQQRSQPPKSSPVMALLSGKFRPVQTNQPNQATPTTDPPYCPAHIICGCTPCPRCASTWIIETYGPTGRTQCHGCKAERSQLGLFDYDVPALTAAAATMTNASALTITQFIDAVITAGYPQLAEMARKYQPANHDTANEGQDR